jgi:DNA mismatch endonuclease (patch repair protein)
MNKKTYIRDGRSPIPKKETTSKLMSSNKDKNTKPEILFRKELWKNDIRGYRLHWKKAPGRPDIAFPSKKLAVFVNGCFWHRCPKCNLSLPKSNTEFWNEKFEKNVERDKKKTYMLKKNGWNVVVIWECEINGNLTECVIRVKRYLNNIKMKFETEFDNYSKDKIYK